MTFPLIRRQYGAVIGPKIRLVRSREGLGDAAPMEETADVMWKRNFMFRQQETVPLEQSENELFHDTEPVLDSAGLTLEKFISVWVQGEGEEDAPTVYTNVYVRTATLDFQKRAGFLQPLQGRSHQVKQILTPGQKAYLKDWLVKASPRAWEAAEDQFRLVFEIF